MYSNAVPGRSSYRPASDQFCPLFVPPSAWPDQFNILPTDPPLLLFSIPMHGQANSDIASSQICSALLRVQLTFH